MIAANHFKRTNENMGDVRAVKIQRTYAFGPQASLFAVTVKETMNLHYELQAAETAKILGLTRLY